MNLDNNESLKRLLLNMKYDSKKTLSENLDRIILNEDKTNKSYLLAVLTNGPGDTSKQLKGQEIPVGSEISKNGDFVDVKSGSINYRFDCKSKIFTSTNIGVTKIFDIYNNTTWVSSSGKVKAGSEMEDVLLTEYCPSKPFDSSTHWVKDQATWQALKNGLQWMLDQGYLCPGGKPCGQKIATDSSDNWIVIDQVYFHKRKEYGAFAGAKCGVKAKLASGGQLSGAVKDKNDSWHIDLFNTFLIDENDGNVKLDIPKYVTKYVRCTEGSKKDEKVVDKTKSDVKTTQTPKKTTVQSGWNETCQGTYSMGCKTPEVGRVQQCLKDQGLYPYTVDDKFGKRTRTAVYNKLGKSSFTDADIETICKTTSGGGGEPQDDFDLDMGRRTGEEQEIDDKTWTGDVY